MIWFNGTAYRQWSDLAIAACPSPGGTAWAVQADRALSRNSGGRFAQDLQRRRDRLHIIGCNQMVC